MEQKKDCLKISLFYDHGNIKLTDIKKTQDYISSANQSLSSNNTYAIEVISIDGHVLDTFKLDMPNYALIDGRGGPTKAPINEAPFILNIPIYKTAKNLYITGPNKKMVLRSDLSVYIPKTQSEVDQMIAVPVKPRSSTGKTVLYSSVLLVAIAIIVIVIITIKKRRANKQDTDNLVMPK